MGTCLPASSKLKVYPPGNTASLVVSGSVTDCGNQFIITPLAAGSGGNPAGGSGPRRPRPRPRPAARRCRRCPRAPPTRAWRRPVRTGRRPPRWRHRGGRAGPRRCRLSRWCGAAGCGLGVEPTDRRDRRTPGPPAAGAAAAGARLALTAAGLALLCACTPTRPRRAPTDGGSVPRRARRRARRVRHRPPPPRRRGPAMARSVPQRLRIPAIGVDTSVMPLGLAADGEVGVPPIEAHAPAGLVRRLADARADRAVGDPRPRHRGQLRRRRVPAPGPVAQGRPGLGGPPGRLDGDLRRGLRADRRQDAVPDIRVCTGTSTTPRCVSSHAAGPASAGAAATRTT